MPFTEINAFGRIGTLVRVGFDDSFRLLGSAQGAAFILEFSLLDGEVHMRQDPASLREGLILRLDGSTQYQQDIRKDTVIKIPEIWLTCATVLTEVILPEGKAVLSFSDRHYGPQRRACSLISR